MRDKSIDIKKEYGLTNDQIAKGLNGLNDDDFYEVMMKLGELNDSAENIDAFLSWLMNTLFECLATREERYLEHD